MQTSFAKTQSPDDSAGPSDPEVLQELTGAEDALVSNLVVPLGGMQGPIDRGDIFLPRLTLVQKTGDLGTQFPLGTYVLNREHLLTHKIGETLTLVVVSIRKYYRERLPFMKGGPRPAIYNSREEMVAAGKWTEYRDGVPGSAEDMADALTLVRQPEALTDSLAFEMALDGKNWALAVWTLQRTSYVRAAKKIFSVAITELSKSKTQPEPPGLLVALWSLASKHETINGNDVIVPVLGLSGRTSEVFRADYRAIFAMR